MGASKKKDKRKLKESCCDKYSKKGEHKRCKRCPCFDMPNAQREKWFQSLREKGVIL
tara:strand:+ start:4062 stop:4232 length:171 start_codon:yes stop_codon:yes gene_type:complete